MTRLTLMHDTANCLCSTSASFILIRKELKKENPDKEEIEPIKKVCPNESCFCTGACQQVIGYRNKTTGEIKYIENGNS